MSAFAKETFSASQADPDLATAAGVPEEAIAAFRAGVPSWKLEQPGVIDSIARATGTDANMIRAGLMAAKARGYGLRAHGVQGPSTFPGQTYPSMR